MSSPSDPKPPTPTPTRRPFVGVWLALSAVIVLAHFALSHRMGLYEDDHCLIGNPMCEWGPADLKAGVKGAVAGYAQGRPLCFVFGSVLAYASTHAAGMLGAYALAALIWSGNVGLCLALLWRRFGPVVATCGALVFALLPADTTHPMLHTAFYVHPSVTFLLLSGIAYSRGRPALSVVLAAVTLLTYETCFLPALAWPVLFPDPVRSVWRRGITHALALGLVLALAVFVRMHLGESRVTGTFTDKRAVVQKVKELATVGPRSALKTFRDRPLATARSWKTDAAFRRPGPGRRTVILVALGAGLAALGALVVARRAERPHEPAPDPARAPDATPAPDAPGPERAAAVPVTGAAAVGRLMVGGALMVVLGYVAALTREPQVVSGRMSSVHIASALGWGVFFGGVAVGLLRLLTAIRAGCVFAPALGAYLCLLAGFHVGVQREYVRAWVAQGEFWKDVAEQCPDVKPGTVILYPLVTPRSEMVREQEWADYMVFRHLFAVPADWATPPRAFPVGHLSWGVPPNYEGYDWNEVERAGDKLYWKHWDSSRVWLEPGNVILLKRTPAGRFERVTGTVRMAGIDLPLKPQDGEPFAFRPHKLYRAMFPNGLAPDAGTSAARGASAVTGR
jgi:hypothetical protein